MSGGDKSAEQRAAEDAAAAIHADEAAEAAEEAINEALGDLDEGGEPSAWETAPTEGPDYEAVIGALQDEMEQMREMRLRDAAEMENLRRRTAREVADAKKFAVSSFARDLLSVSDNLTRAQTVISDDDKAAASDVWRNLLEGVQMTERELLSVLDKNGVKKIDPRGSRFDPNQHQAMFEVPDPSQPAGMVTEVVAPGFMIGERVLRPAMVGVSKGGPKMDPKVERRGAAEPEQAPKPTDGAHTEGVDRSV